ncbi:hypothetical protein BGX34_002587 [Mortierella sp. NVP85]|nr:hypothetical protein BGX34_002587 [Mortierella sp. NVP85]
MKKHATDLSEVRQHIARHLDLDTLKSCSLVCKTWHLDFHPVLWELFTCKVPKQCSESPEKYATWMDITSQKAHLFRHIYDGKTRGPMPPEIRDIVLRCHRLITIEVSVAENEYSDPIHYWEETLRPFIERSKVSLQRLLLREVTPVSMTSLQLPGLLAGLPRLRSLELEIGSTMEDVFPILEACLTSLECLDLRILRSKPKRSLVNQNDSATDQHNSPSQSLVHREATNSTPLRLKHLSVHGICYDGALKDILSHVAIHSLESLQVNAVVDDQFFLLMSPALNDTLSRLTELNIRSLHPDHLSAFLMFLIAIPPHQLRKTNTGPMDTECVDMLIQKQHQSLESLIGTFQWGHTRALGDILATCHKLKNLDFRAERLIDIRTLIDPQRPWVCTELEVFEGHFGLPPPLHSLASNENDDKQDGQEEDYEKVATTDQVESLFLERLGRLTKLRRLAQGYEVVRYFYTMETDNENVMAWTLSSGLRHLTDLVNLRWLEFYDEDLPPSIGIPELMFIKRHWVNLQGLGCNKIDAAEVKEWLATEWPELEVKLKHGSLEK